MKSDGKVALDMLPSFDRTRKRTFSSTSSVFSSSSTTSSVPSKFPFAVFYLGHLRRKPAFLLCLLTALLLLPLALHRVRLGSISQYISNLPSPFHQQKLDDSPEPEPRPLTELGFEADYVYENIGSTSLADYRDDLEGFLLSKFPSSDADERDPDSLMSILHTFVPPAARGQIIHPQKALQHLVFMPWRWAFKALVRLWVGPPPEAPKPVQPTIPKKIFQTGPFEGKEPPPQKLLPRSWKKHNPNHMYQYFDNTAAAEYVNARFNESFVNGGKGGGVAQTYMHMKDVPVMQSDFWRYAILATEGGVYSDFDTKCLKPVDRWHKKPWRRNLFENEPSPEPAIIVGIEVDVGSRSDWHSWWPRPLGLVQWTIASTKGHPILIDAMRRVVEAISQTNASASSAEGQHLKVESIVETTGPGPFTDSVLRYLGARYNVTWPALRHLSNEGILFGHEGVPADVLVLSVTAFSPGVGQFGSGDVKSEAALVQHLFAGSWKHG